MQIFKRELVICVYRINYINYSIYLNFETNFRREIWKLKNRKKGAVTKREKKSYGTFLTQDVADERFRFSLEKCILQYTHNKKKFDIGVKISRSMEYYSDLTCVMCYNDNLFIERNNIQSGCTGINLKRTVCEFHWNVDQILDEM